ncbi:MAG: TetR/AcrR family transcriptional regulator [Negativicutes bacterium]|nr:TetR/AcrR family transcriptional regulator [Negativicutes bacterium]
MPRISKDPEIRKAEIMGAAEAHFKMHGYHETQIGDIVKAIGVAQGTFYYYFKSKEEIVEAIVKQKLTQVIDEIESIADSKEMNALAKISSVIRRIYTGSIQDDGSLIFEYLYNDKYFYILDRIGRQFRELFSPQMQKIVDEGIQQGIFRVAYPNGAVDFIQAVIRCLVESLYKKESDENMAQRKGLAQKLIQTTLGIECEIVCLNN